MLQELDQIDGFTAPVWSTPRGEQWSVSFRNSSERWWDSDLVNVSMQDSCSKQKKDKQNYDYDRNKVLLRSIRRFYMKIFKAENPKLVNRRFWKFKSYLFIAAFKKIIQSHGIFRGQEDKIYDLADFMFRFLGIIPNDKKRYCDESERKGKLIQDCMYKFSNQKFIRVWNIDKYRMQLDFLVILNLMKIKINCLEYF